MVVVSTIAKNIGTNLGKKFYLLMILLQLLKMQ